ncbi:MAG: hypothetical protein FJW30_21905 [Acidobacteria bacterium]|nr:hypothetical protein [Acidobacteriota bacterium]
MPKSFDAGTLLGSLGLRRNDPRAATRLGIGLLLALNLVAGWFVINPWGGSADEMEDRLNDLRKQVAARQTTLQRTRQLAAKIDKGRTQGNDFLNRYFLSRPTTYSTVVSELHEMAKRAGVRAKENSYVEEEVEGSTELTMMSITASYEGSYSDLLHFLRELDRSNRLIIIESLAASPQQGTGVLSITLRLNSFIRELTEGQQLATVAGGAQAQ